MIITIDGPAASGKSTISRMVAHKLDCYYLYSGLVYRALAYLLLTERGYTTDQLHDPSSDDVTVLLDPNYLIYTYDHKKGERIVYKNDDITPFLKSEQVDIGASIVSANKQVRDQINHLLRHIVETKSLVVDGRDAGSHIFPDAQYKFFLTASLAVRAQRWRNQQQEHGVTYTQQEAESIIDARDARDTQRAVAPLIKPDDAYVIDSSDMTRDQVVTHILSFI